MTELKEPKQGQHYLGKVTDTRRWEGFQHRPDDIFVCTPPKCGTTWTQAICAMLVFGDADHGQQPGMISPWIDASFRPIEEDLAMVESQTHRRYFKTHSPFDGIPYHRECTYFVVLRDPRDAYFSGCNHRDNMNDEELAHSFPHGPDAFNQWLTGSCEPGKWDWWTLATMIQFFDSYWPYRNLENVHLFHYSDMKRDLEGTIKTMASALGLNYGDDKIREFAAAASFDHMKNNAMQFAPQSGTGLWKSEAGFFATGKNEQWKEKWGAWEIAAFETRIAELLSPDEVAWILHGDG